MKEEINLRPNSDGITELTLETLLPLLHILEEISETSIYKQRYATG